MAVRTLVALVAVLVVAALLLALLVVFQRQLVYFPHPSDVGRASDYLPQARAATLRTADRLELGAWFVPAAQGDRGVTVLVANGNAGNRAMRAPLAAALARSGLSVLLFDYRGFGGNPGRPTEEGLARDARAAQRFLVDEVGVRPDRLLYYGESLGAAVAARLATERAPAGLVLRSPFTDLASVGRVHYPFLPVHPVLLMDRYPVADLVARMTVPTTVVYGTRDSVVPPDQSRSVAAASAGPTRIVVVEGADHNDSELLEGRALIDAVVELADRVRRAP
jgi:uncharacterized protein